MLNQKNEYLTQIEQANLGLKYNHEAENEKIKILYSHLPISIFASLVCSSVIYFTVIHPFYFYQKIWYAAVIAISILRFLFILIRHYTPQHPKLHLSLFILGVILSASAWGIIGSFLMPENNLLQQVVVVIIIAGVSGGGMQSLQANLTSAILFLTLTILPLCVWLFTQGGFEFYVLGVAMITYLFFCGFSAFRNNRLINQVLTLNFNNSKLASHLSMSNEELTTKNTELERHEKDMSMINNMNEKLQLCRDSIEANSIIKLTAEHLFGDFYGGLTITDTGGKQALVVEWGNKKHLQTKFLSESCWGLRSGNKYLVDEHQKNLLCKHYNAPPEGSYCIPLIIDNKSLGMINFNFLTDTSLTNYIMQLMTVFSDVVKLALANIQLQEKLQSEATRDPLTNLFNRRYLNETLLREFHRNSREKSSLCFAILDLDYFKNFNDTYGHEAGDIILKKIGTLLMSNIRESDIACRFGGEEFALVFINTTIDKILPSLEHIRKEVENTKIYFNNDLLPPITTSIGVAQAPEQGKTVSDIIRAADVGLYEAKKLGRNRIITASQSAVSPNN